MKRPDLLMSDALIFPIDMVGEIESYITSNQLDFVSLVINTDGSTVTIDLPVAIEEKELWNLYLQLAEIISRPRQ